MTFCGCGRQDCGYCEHRRAGIAEERAKWEARLDKLEAHLKDSQKAGEACSAERRARLEDCLAGMRDAIAVMKGWRP